jgi:hypothetical protein
MKKLLFLSVTLFFVLFISGCVTSALYKDSAEAHRDFVEEVSSFLITADGKQLIVVGKQHHYIFAANDETLKFILTWPEKKRVKAGFENFVINSNQAVSGMYTLTVDATQDLTAESNQLLVSKGFVNNTTQKTLTYHGALHGTRYLADKFVLPATMQLNQKYTITMREDYAYSSASSVLGRLLLTPLAIAADGLLLIGGIPVYLLSGSLGLQK